MQRHSIHGMIEEENVVRPHQEMASLSYQEKKYLLAVERGDVASVRRWETQFFRKIKNPLHIYIYIYKLDSLLGGKLYTTLRGLRNEDEVTKGRIHDVWQRFGKKKKKEKALSLRSPVRARASFLSPRRGEKLERHSWFSLHHPTVWIYLPDHS